MHVPRSCAWRRGSRDRARTLRRHPPAARGPEGCLSLPGLEAGTERYDHAVVEGFTANEVGNTFLIGTHPVSSAVSSDNTMLYVSNFGSNAVAVYDIDMGKIVASLPVGSQPDGLALSASQNYLLVLDSQSGDVTVIQKRNPRKLEPTEYSLLTMIPVGVQPNGIVVKAFMTSTPAK